MLQVFLHDHIIVYHLFNSKFALLFQLLEEKIAIAFYETRHLGAAKRALTIRAQQKGRRTKRAQGKRAKSKKGAEQKGRRAKRAQNKKGARSRCCVTVTFKVVISSDNRVLSQSFFFFFFFFCRNIIPSLRLHCLKYVSIKSLKTEESYNTKL